MIDGVYERERNRNEQLVKKRKIKEVKVTLYGIKEKERSNNQ